MADQTPPPLEFKDLPAHPGTAVPAPVPPGDRIGYEVEAAETEEPDETPAKSGGKATTRRTADKE